MIRYAPYIDGTIPAFTLEDGIKVPFEHNLAVGSYNGMVLMFKDINGNNIQYIETKKQEGQVVAFSAANLKLNCGDYYKVQLAYYDTIPTETVKESGVEREIQRYDKLTYSSVGVTKYIGEKVELNIISLNPLKYEFKCDDLTEHLSTLSQQNYNLSFSSNYYDYNNWSKTLSSEDSDLPKGILGFVKNQGANLKISSSDYVNKTLVFITKIKEGLNTPIKVAPDIYSSHQSFFNLPEEQVMVFENLPYQNGVTRGTLYLIFISPANQIVSIENEKTKIFLIDEKTKKDKNLIKGNNYLINIKASTINNYEINMWINYSSQNEKDKLETFDSFKTDLNFEYGEITGEIPPNYTPIRSKDSNTYEDIVFPDRTIEHGQIYYYGFRDSEGNWDLLNIPVASYFEDMFLQDATHMLRIKFNPKVSSFKHTIQEQKVDALGSRYPYFFRNGDMDYVELPISGLISYHMQESGRGWSDEDIGLINDDSKRSQTFDSQNFENLGRTTNLTDHNIAAERKFKLSVLEWLNNGQPKLFRSPTEGNYVVRLMNVSLSPDEKLGRMLHTFSATAYECAAADYPSLKALGLVPNEVEQ